MADGCLFNLFTAVVILWRLCRLQLPPDARCIRFPTKLMFLPGIPKPDSEEENSKDAILATNVPEFSPKSILKAVGSHFCLLNLLINTKVAYNKYYTRTVIRNVGNR